MAYNAVESRFLEPPKETKMAREIGCKITEKYNQGKRKLVREIGRFEKSGGFEKSGVKLQRSITKGNGSWFEKSGSFRNLDSTWRLLDLPVIKLLSQPPQRSNAARVRNMSWFNGGKLPGNSKHSFKKSKDKAVPGKRIFKRWVSVEKFVFVYLWLYRLLLCFVTVFPAKLSYELHSVNALNWYRFSRHWQPEVT